MKLVDNWTDAWKWVSFQCNAGLITVATVWATVPADIKTPWVARWEEYLVILLAAAAMFGRLIQQQPKDGVLPQKEIPPQ